MTTSAPIVHNGRVYFSEAELSCKGSGLLILADGFANKLLELRIMYGKPMIVTSACRSRSHNTAVRGASNSYHICDTGRGCAAVDVSMVNAVDRARLAELALGLGWSVGVNATFLHLDRRVDFGAEKLMFLY